MYPGRGQKFQWIFLCWYRRKVSLWYSRKFCKYFIYIVGQIFGSLHGRNFWYALSHLTGAIMASCIQLMTYCRSRGHLRDLLTERYTVWLTDWLTDLITIVFGRAVAQVVSRRPVIAEAMFAPGSVHVKFMMDRVALGRVFPEAFVFPC